MYCTPCARLMKSITPNTSVSPAAIRNRMIPNCSPLRVWTRRRVADIDRGRIANSEWRIGTFYSPFAIRYSPAGLARRLAVLRIHVAVVLEDLLDDLGLELAVRALCDLHQVEVLDRIAVGVELERPAGGLEVGLADRRRERLLVGGVAAGRLEGGVDQLRGVVGLHGVGARHVAELLLERRDEGLVDRVVHVRRPGHAAEEADGG